MTLRARLKLHQHTQQSFADLTGVDVRSVGRWVRGVQDTPRWVWVILDLMDARGS